VYAIRSPCFIYHGKNKITLNETDASIRYDNSKFRWENEQPELWMILYGRRLRWFRSPMVSSPTVLYSGYREEPRSRSGRSLGTAKHRSTPLRGTLATINYLCCECCAATNPRHRSCTRVAPRSEQRGPEPPRRRVSAL